MSEQHSKITISGLPADDQITAILEGISSSGKWDHLPASLGPDLSSASKSPQRQNPGN